MASLETGNLPPSLPPKTTLSTNTSRIGTFIGHKGAVWSSRLSSDATLAATGSADFTAKIWDPQTGECHHTLPHNHIVKAVAFPQQPQPTVVATAGLEKKLRIFDLSHETSNGTSTNGSSDKVGIEIGPNEHTLPIKSVVWNPDYNILTTAAEDKMLRWWDLRVRQPIAKFETTRPITSCELNGGAEEVVSVAAGNTAYFFSPHTPGQLLKSVNFDHDIASIAASITSPSSFSNKSLFVTGGLNDTWVRLWEFSLHSEEKAREIEVQKGHHGPIWSVSFSPDGKVYATGSEDGTIKLWKACKEGYGLWR